MSGGGQVNITVVDGGSASIIVPGSNVQLVLGCAVGGPTNQIVATQAPATLQTNFTGGQLPEAAALSALAGGTILAIRVATATPGTANTPVTTGTGTALAHVSVTLDGTNGAWDDFLVVWKCLNGGTLGTAGITYQVSIDGGKNFGPVFALGTALTVAIPNTGITLVLGTSTQTYVAKDSFQFATVAPAWNDAGVLVALNVFLASQYALTGVGSVHLVGVAAGTDASTVEGYLDNWALNYLYARMIMSARDAAKPVAWGGAGETEATWMNSILTDFGAVSAKRVCVAAAYWNMPSAFPNAVAGAPRFRRSIAWAWAARQVTIPPQRHAGRVSDGALSQIVVDPTNDPQDGFIYHDERINSGLDYIIAGSGGRFASAMTRTGYGGVFLSNPLSMAPLGSNFFLLPLGLVIDVTSDILHQELQLEIDVDVRVNTNGTIYEGDAQSIEHAVAAAINDVQFASRQISQKVVGGEGFVISRTWNVELNNSLQYSCEVVQRGYVLRIDGTVGFQSSTAAS